MTIATMQMTMETTTPTATFHVSKNKKHTNHYLEQLSNNNLYLGVSNQKRCNSVSYTRYRYGKYFRK